MCISPSERRGAVLRPLPPAVQCRPAQGAVRLVAVQAQDHSLRVLALRAKGVTIPAPDLKYWRWPGVERHKKPIRIHAQQFHFKVLSFA